MLIRDVIEVMTNEHWQGFVTLLKIERGVFGLHSYNHAAATTSRQVCMAEALKARCVLAEMRWRWT